ncbi:MAG: GTP-binding protein, partial [Bacillota bacterium]
MMTGPEIPVYLFTGFLGSGKTTFIQDLLEGSDFNAGERTLLLLCEEGEVELKPEAFASPEVFIERIREEDLEPGRLAALARKHRIERVIIEYNGMWMLQDLFNSTPDSWVIYQEMLFADAGTFMMYNTNMRQLTFNK